MRVNPESIHVKSDACGGGTAPVGADQQLAEQGHSIGCRFAPGRPCAGKIAPNAEVAPSSHSRHQNSPAGTETQLLAT